MCLPSEPVAGMNFFPSLPVLGAVPGRLNINNNSEGAPLSLPTVSVQTSHWQPRFTLPAAAASSAGDTSKTVLFSSLRLVGRTSLA